MKKKERAASKIDKHEIKKKYADYLVSFSTQKAFNCIQAGALIAGMSAVMIALVFTLQNTFGFDKVLALFQALCFLISLSLTTLAFFVGEKISLPETEDASKQGLLKTYETCEKQLQKYRQKKLTWLMSALGFFVGGTIFLAMTILLKLF
jgi:hypothetical protein